MKCVGTIPRRLIKTHSTVPCCFVAALLLLLLREHAAVHFLGGAHLRGTAHHLGSFSRRAAEQLPSIAGVHL